MPWEKNFDVDVALQKAGETFWSRGYEATSVRDLLAAMGIQKGSFYATYGSKRDAYLRALDQYIDARSTLDGTAHGESSPRHALELHLEDVLAECVGPDGRLGCMAVNCALELALVDDHAQKAVLRAFSKHEDFILEQILAAQAEGEVSSEIDAEAAAKAIFAIVIAMRVQARAGASKTSLRTLAEQASALLGP